MTEMLWAGLRKRVAKCENMGTRLNQRAIDGFGHGLLLAFIPTFVYAEGWGAMSVSPMETAAPLHSSMPNVNGHAVRAPFWSASIDCGAPTARSSSETQRGSCMFRAPINSYYDGRCGRVLHEKPAKSARTVAQGLGKCPTLPRHTHLVHGAGLTRFEQLG